MSEMIERMAKGMHEARANSRTKWEDCDEDYCRGTMRDAHAAIRAMREPTDAMTMVRLNPEEAETYWRLMIDEALK